MELQNLKDTSQPMRLPKSKYKKFKFNRDMPIYAMLFPAVFLVFVFSYLPIYGIIIGFQDYNPVRGVFASKWVGISNFTYFLKDPSFWRVMKNTIVLNLYQLVVGFPVPIIFALLLNELTILKYKKVIQTISYLPHFLSWVVVASIVATVLSPDGGALNTILKLLFGIEPIYFLAKKEYFRTIIVLSAIWKGFGLSSVYYISALSSIDPELYEAAHIDGAGRLKQTRYITLPGLKTIAIILLILQVGSITGIGFEQIFLLYNPHVYEVGEVISTYTYRLGIEQSEFSRTTAIGITQSIVNFGMVMGTNYLSRRVAGWSLW